MHLRKIFRYFAKFSPFNSFRINESISETAKMAVKLRAKYASQPIWNQYALCHIAACVFSLVHSLKHDSQPAIQDPRAPSSANLRSLSSPMSFDYPEGKQFP